MPPVTRTTLAIIATLVTRATLAIIATPAFAEKPAIKAPAGKPTYAQRVIQAPALQAPAHDLLRVLRLLDRIAEIKRKLTVQILRSRRLPLDAINRP